MSGFSLPIIRELHRHLMLSPADVRARYADRLERFLLELEPARTYPYEFVYFRIVGVRPPAGLLDTFTGSELTPDLVLLLERLDEDADPAEAPSDEDTYTLEELRERYGVTARTVRRWRRRGLPTRKYVFPDGSRRRGVRGSALERFMEANPGLLSLSGRAGRLTDEEERDILRRVAACRKEGLSTTAAAARVAGEVGRARETVRLVLKRRMGGDDEARTSLTDEQRRALLADYRRKVPVQKLAARAGRSCSSIYRIINQERARELLARPVAYVAGEGFEDPDARDSIVGPEWAALLERLESLPADASASARRSPLSREQERCLFRAYNFTKFLLRQALRELNPGRYVPTRALEQAEELVALAERIRRLIVRLYLPLVETVIRQHAGGPVPLPELRAEGTALLRQRIESFDCAGRGRFGPLVTLDVQKAFARLTAGRGADAAPPG